jgi:hypothetical protein
MAEIWKFLKEMEAEYGLLTLIYILIGFGFVYLVRKSLEHTVENVIDTAFARQKKEIELIAERQSAFIEKVQTDQLTAVHYYFGRLESIMADLNRSRGGFEVPKLFKISPSGERDIVPLTAVFVELESKKTVLGQKFYELLKRRADIVLRFASAGSDAELKSIMEDKQKNADEINRLVDREFNMQAARRGE